MKNKDMSPKEKAEELVDFFIKTPPVKMSDYTKVYHPTAREFARKVCDEVLNYTLSGEVFTYWTQVKEELDNL